MASPTDPRSNAREFLSDMFSKLFDPDSSIERIDDFMTGDYSQQVNGIELDHDGFVDHLTTLKAATSEVVFDFHEVVQQGDLIGERHTVTATKTDGSTVTGEVHAFHHLVGNKVARIVELTQMTTGTAEDEDLGSRTSAD